MPVPGMLHQLYLLSPSENVSLVDDTVLLTSAQMGSSNVALNRIRQVQTYVHLGPRAPSRAQVVDVQQDLL